MTITREPQNGKQTIGKIDLEGYELVSMELAWNNNERGKSCIPPTIIMVDGKEQRVRKTYHAKPRTSKKYSKHFIIEDTSPREFCLFHPANYSRQLRGCIAPGMGVKDLDKDGLKDIYSSKKAMAILLDKFPNGFDFEIIQL